MKINFLKEVKKEKNIMTWLNDLFICFFDDLRLRPNLLKPWATLPITVLHELGSKAQGSTTSRNGLKSPNFSHLGDLVETYATLYQSPMSSSTQNGQWREKKKKKNLSLRAKYIGHSGHRIARPTLNFYFKHKSGIQD